MGPESAIVVAMKPSFVETAGQGANGHEIAETEKLVAEPGYALEDTGAFVDHAD